MVEEHWVPNHFVPVLAIDSSMTEQMDVENERSKKVEAEMKRVDREVEIEKAEIEEVRENK